MLLGFGCVIQLYLILSILPNLTNQFLLENFMKNKVLSTYRCFPKSAPLNKFDVNLKNKRQFCAHDHQVFTFFKHFLIKTVNTDFYVKTQSSQKETRDETFGYGERATYFLAVRSSNSFIDAIIISLFLSHFIKRPKVLILLCRFRKHEAL